MEAIVVPQPEAREREALLAALDAAADEPAASAWRRAALLEGTEAEEA